MISMHAVRARKTTLLEVHNIGAGGLVFRYHEVIARIAKRFGTDFALAWTRVLVQFKTRIDESQLISAIASGNRQMVESIVYPHALQLQLQRALKDPLLRSMQAAGQASAKFLKAKGISIDFNTVHPNVVLYAQTKAAELVTSITPEIQETIRLITAYGASGRATVTEQARMIREVVGLPRNWVMAPIRFGDELRAAARTGDIGTLSRRLSAVDMTRVRSAIENGTADQAFINEMEGIYAERLINLRATTIARTESLAAANRGAQESWTQAISAGDLPGDVKQFWIVTPDDRLCPICSQIPGMNPDGVGIGELFDTPEGPVDAPPAPHPNCRCALGLVLPGGTQAALPFEEDLTLEEAAAQ